MISCSGCPPCEPLFIVERWIYRYKTFSTLNISRSVDHDNFTGYRKFEQHEVPVNIFHSLFKSIESTNL